MEALSRMFIKEEQIGNLHGIKISRASPFVSHLLYADDLLVFSNGSASDAACILRCIDKFSSWTGQKVNMDKSSFFLGSNYSCAVQAELLAILNLRLLSSNAKHFGLPLFFQQIRGLPLRI
ncbi:hypothetical protein SLA2020_433570 [Shorea laevis]